ncbi:MAG: HIT family protein [Methyloglobulus sp.]|nr:HIT domain-containing protein [Methyloglobulus sp.]
MKFKLHPQLKQDCIAIGRFELCHLLMINDSQFPWFVLVPEINGITEIFQLNKPQQSLLIEESSTLADTLNTLYNADKINIAAIGNLVPQLHIHHVVRYRTDKVWPAPIWGKLPAIAYLEQELSDTLGSITHALQLKSMSFSTS